MPRASTPRRVVRSFVRALATNRVRVYAFGRNPINRAALLCVACITPNASPSAPMHAAVGARMHLFARVCAPTIHPNPPPALAPRSASRQSVALKLLAARASLAARPSVRRWLAARVVARRRRASSSSVVARASSRRRRRVASRARRFDRPSSASRRVASRRRAHRRRRGSARDR